MIEAARSLQSIAYYRGVVLPDLLAGLRANAHAAEEVCVFDDPLFFPGVMTERRRIQCLHLLLKRHLLGSSLKRTPVTRPGFSEWVDRVILYAADRGIYIRLPKEVL